MSEKQSKSLIAGYLSRLHKLTDSGGVYAYRGQGDEDWPVESAASRRIKEESLSFFIEYHQKELLEPARMNGYGIKDGRKLSDLELLADLQHNGAATCLIDFTRNFLVALWFACQNKEKNGKVFILDTNNTDNFLSLEKDDLEQGIKDILNFRTRTDNEDKTVLFSRMSPSYWHWSPHGINKRILKQDTVFIFGKKGIDEKHLNHIEIPKENKSEVVEELRRLGIKRESLFKDMQGFAASHGHNESLPREYNNSLSAEEYLREGNKAHQRGDLDAAIQHYERATELDPNYAIAYGSLGMAKMLLGKNEEAIKDLNKAVELDPNFGNAYGLRGIAKLNLGKNEESIKDFDKAIELGRSLLLFYHKRGDAKRGLSDTQGAVQDYNQAKKLAEKWNDKATIEEIEEINRKLSELHKTHGDK